MIFNIGFCHVQQTYVFHPTVNSTSPYERYSWLVLCTYVRMCLHHTTACIVSYTICRLLYILDIDAEGVRGTILNINVG